MRNFDVYYKLDFIVLMSEVIQKYYEEIAQAL